MSKSKSKTAKPVKKTTGKVNKKDKKESAKKRKRDYSSYSHFIHKVLVETHAGLKINMKAMNIMNSFVLDMLGRLALEASKLTVYKGSQTLTESDIRAACSLHLSGELLTIAKLEGEKALAKYWSSEKKKN